MFINLTLSWVFISLVTYKVILQQGISISSIIPYIQTHNHRDENPQIKTLRKNLCCR